MAGTAIFVACIFTGAVAAEESDQSELPARLKQTVDAVVATYHQGDPVKLGQLLAARGVRLQAEQRAAFDVALARQGVPSVGELLVVVRMALKAQKREKALPKLTFNERLLMLHGVDQHVAGALLSASESIAGYEESPVPKTLDDLEARLRMFAPTWRRLAIAGRWAKYGTSLASRIVGRRLSRLDAADREVVEWSNDEREKNVRRVQEYVEEVQMEVRLNRLRFGVDVLKNPELSKERFLAAWTTAQDAQALKEFLKPPPQTAEGKPDSPPAAADALRFTRSSLNEPDLFQTVAELEQAAAELAGDLVGKSRLFFEGLGWWLRGRFGWGPDLLGLAKSEAALKDPESLIVLSMPFEIPMLVAPRKFSRLKATHIDRRHHYTWIWEDRQLIRSSHESEWKRGAARQVAAMIPAVHITTSKLEYVNIVPEVTAKHANDLLPALRSQKEWKTKTFYQSVHLPPQDPRLIYRLVGFVEYGLALERLDEFLSQASLQEIEIADEFVRDREELVVYTNLSRPLEKQRTIVSELGRNERDDFSRRGLPWILALARVEVGAMLAGFSTASKPFALTAPTPKSERFTSPYGTAEYAEMLLDGARMHYWSLKRDPAVWNYYKTGVPENHLVTYNRRVTVARHLLAAARTYAPLHLNSAQLKLLNQWDWEIAKVNRMLLYCLSKKVGEKRTTYTKSTLRTYLPTHDTKTTEKFQEIESGSPLHELLLTVDPTLIACPCR